MYEPVLPCCIPVTPAQRTILPFSAALLLVFRMLDIFCSALFEGFLLLTSLISVLLRVIFPKLTAQMGCDQAYYADVSRFPLFLSPPTCVL